jgi:dTDP-4-dehydrorhamnose reductase
MLLHVSTDYVFDGEKGAPYDELDRPNPLSVYARTKLAGEEHVRALAPESFVVRTGYVFGAGTDYLTGALRRLSAGEAAGGLTDRIGSPTFVRHLAERLLPLALTHRFGTYHVAGPEPASWFDVLARGRAIAGLPGAVDEQRSTDLGLPAPRPRYSAMTSVYASPVGLAPFPSLDAALRELIASL